MVKHRRLVRLIAAFLSSIFFTGIACGAGSLSSVQFAGIMALGDEVQVCILNPVTGKSAWLTVGERTADVWAESFDSSREAVVLRAGEARRTLSLREAKVQSLPVAHLPDGRVDWFHMQLTDEEKVHEAETLMWDILEVGRLARKERRGGKRKAKATK